MATRRAVLGLVVVVLLGVVTACTRPEGQTEIGAAPGGPPGTQGAAGPAPAQDQALRSGDFGTLKHVCGGGKKASVAPGTVGVRDGTIHLGVFSDPGQSVRAGLNQELFDASDVFVSWCNALGGVNGFKLVADHLDSALFNVKPKMIEACQKDFFLVGGGAVFDSDGEQTRLGCLLPNDPAYVVSAQSRGADLVVQAAASTIQTVNFGLARELNEKFPDAKNRIGYLTGNLPALLLTDAQYQAAGAEYGWKKVYGDQYNAAGTVSWVPYAQDIKASGVKGLFYTGEPENLGKLIAAFGQIGYKLDFIAASANHYDKKLLDNGGKAFDVAPVYILQQLAPYDQKPLSPAIKQYLDLFAAYKPNGKSHASLGLLSFSSWLFFATSLRKCEVISRKCVFETMQKTKKWDAGGLQAASDPSSGIPSDCFTTVVATNAGFKVVPWKANSGIYNCDKANIVTIKAELGRGVKLSDVGKSMSDFH